MQRFLTLWLTLVAAGWLTRAAVSALLFERAGGGAGLLVQVFAVSLLQAALLAWATRPGAPRRSRPEAAGVGATNERRPRAGETRALDQLSKEG